LLGDLFTHTHTQKVLLSYNSEASQKIFKKTLKKNKETLSQGNLFSSRLQTSSNWEATEPIRLKKVKLKVDDLNVLDDTWWNPEREVKVENRHLFWYFTKFCRKGCIFSP